MPAVRVHGKWLPVRLPASQKGAFVSGHNVKDVSGCQRGDGLPGELQLHSQRPGKPSEIYFSGLFLSDSSTHLFFCRLPETASLQRIMRLKCLTLA